MSVVVLPDLVWGEKWVITEGWVGKSFYFRVQNDHDENKLASRRVHALLYSVRLVLRRITGAQQARATGSASLSAARRP